MKNLYLILLLWIISSVLKVSAASINGLPTFETYFPVSSCKAQLCNTYAGTMDQNLVDFCIGQVDTVVHYKDQLLDPDDALLFVIHDGSGPALGNVFGVSTTPYFPYNPLILSPETVYYISAVAGNSLGPGNIDLGDPCLSVAIGTPVIYHKAPTIKADDVTICIGNTAKIEFELTGTGPFLITILKDNKPFISEEVNDDKYDLIDTPATTTFYSVTIKDKYCVSDVYKSVKVSILKDITVSKPIFKCSQDKQFYTIEFKITNGDPASYKVTGLAGTLKNGNFTSNELPAGSLYSFTVEDKFGCNPTILSGVYSCDCETSAGVLVGKPRYYACVGDTIKFEHNAYKLDSDDILEYVLCKTNIPTLSGVHFPPDKPEVWFKKSSMLDGVTYYLFAVVGSKLASSSGIDPADSCISYSNYLKISFDNIPKFKLVPDEPKVDCEEFTLDINTKNLTEIYNDEIFKYWTTTGGNIVSIDSLDKISAIVDKNGIYRLTLLNKRAGCTYSQDTLIDIQVSKPEIKLNHITQLSCQNPEINLDASGSSYLPLCTIKWKTTTGNIVSGADGLNPIVSKGGLYYIEIDDPKTNCHAIDSVLVEPSPFLSVANVIVKDPSCNNTRDGILKMENITGGSPPYEYSINGTPSGNIDFKKLGGGNYEIEIRDTEGCQYDTLIVLTTPEKINIELGEDITVEWGELISLNPELSVPFNELDSLIWINMDNESCNYCLQPQYIARESKIIQVIAKKNTCSDKDEIRVIVEKHRNVFIPNSFSPNADGVNDEFAIFGDQHVTKVKKFEVFDRWGNSMFSAESFTPDGIQGAWNGKSGTRYRNETVYIYYALIEFSDGETEMFKGDVTLVR